MTHPKRHPYRPPKQWLSDPLNVLRVNATLPPDQIASLDVEARSAWERLRSGVGDASDWDTLADVSNLCGLISNRLLKKAKLLEIQLAQALCDQCKQAAQSLAAMDARAAATGKYAACHLSIKAVPELLDTYAQLLSVCTAKEMMDALYEAKQLKATS